MTPFLLKYICDPVSKAPLELIEPIYDDWNNIQSGILVSASGNKYPIINGIPRFVDYVQQQAVISFGDEWNYFNFIDHKINWIAHTVQNTFGSTDVFKGKLIIDAGGGSGAQTKWFAEYGASHVILLDLSHSVDDVVQRNLMGLKNVDVIQCTIDAPPIRDGSIDGIVYCHNVIQHTPSVEKTAHTLYALTAPGGEFVFNCYQLNDQGPIRWIRWNMIYRPLRYFISRMPFWFILAYARVMAILRIVPGLGWLLEKLLLVAQGEVPVIGAEPVITRLKRRIRSATLNTFDTYGAHLYQHHKRDIEIRALVKELQPDYSKILNADKYFQRPPPIGCALRVFR
jgi:SAM-dependent methyltransferase